MSHCPDRGEVVMMDFDPQAGHEQADRRPALVISPASYNGRTSLAIVCPISNQDKGNSFAVQIIDCKDVSGVILSDHIKSLDWNARSSEYICELPIEVVEKVLHRVSVLISQD